MHCLHSQVSQIFLASQLVLVVKNLPANAGAIRGLSLILVSGRFPWRRAWQPTSEFLPGASHGQRWPGELQSTGLQSQTRPKWLNTTHSFPTIPHERVIGYASETNWVITYFAFFFYQLDYLPFLLFFLERNHIPVDWITLESMTCL